MIICKQHLRKSALNHAMARSRTVFRTELSWSSIRDGVFVVAKSREPAIWLTINYLRCKRVPNKTSSLILQYFHRKHEADEFIELATAGAVQAVAVA